MKPEQSLYYLYVGDGISGVFIKNGRMHEGVDGLAKNPGKMLVTWGNRLARVEQVVSGEWQREEGFAERMRPLFTAIYNVLWLLDPDYFVIAANDLATARRLCDGAVKFASLAGEGELPLSTKFVLSDNCDASQTGILQKLIDRYLRAV